MAYIGNPNSDTAIGSSLWYIGSWFLVNNASSSVEGTRDYDDAFVYRDDAANILTAIDFGPIAPGSLQTQDITFEYRGTRRIKIDGFVIVPLPKKQYLGSRNKSIDAADITRWADNYNPAGGAAGSGIPGLELVQVNESTTLTETRQFKSAQGDSAANPLPYTGHTNGVLELGEKGSITLRLQTPEDSLKEVQFSHVVNFGIAIAFSEIPQSVDELL